jgi:hypothetical protein
VEIVLVGAGIACLIAAAAGVTIKALNVQIEAITSGRRQLLLAALGAAFLGGGIVIDRVGATTEGTGDTTGDTTGATTVATTVATTTDEGSTTQPLLPSDRRIRPASVVATSTLQEQSGFSYAPQNLLDNDQTTAWCEGASGNGIGESITFTFRKPIRLSRVDVINGYNKEDRFRLNARAQNIDLVTTEDRRLATLRDTSAVQNLPVPESPTTFVELAIKSAYPGSQFTDLCLTDIQFVGAPAR